MAFWANISRGIASMVSSAVAFAESIGAGLGASTTLTSWGVSSATLAGGAVIIGVIVIGGVAYHVYTRRQNNINQNQNPPPQNPPPRNPDP